MGGHSPKPSLPAKKKKKKKKKACWQETRSVNKTPNNNKRLTVFLFTMAQLIAFVCVPYLFRALLCLCVAFAVSRNLVSQVVRHARVLRRSAVEAVRGRGGMFISVRAILF